ncbi:MAG: hypothetical protein PHW25_08960 [Zoogloea sp.]|uniref:hypothetical protein n=1 Tax=Zoogloea sp. TaxID=49181 RepID=UPI00261897DF|nr:hypothetical protein [Zoogloea sp.]MDD3327197.1 hypothetical protein [Zoogloea sp.]
MKSKQGRFVLALASLLLAGTAWAQPSPDPATSADARPAPGMGRGMGPGAGMGPRHCMQADPARPNCGWRMNRRNSPGYGLMSPDERAAHQSRLRGMQSREECLAYLQDHHAQMGERAKAQGKTLPAPRMRLCDRLPPASTR